MNENFRDFFSGLTRERKLIYLAGALIIYIMMFLFCALIWGFLATLGFPTHSYIWHGIHDAFGMTFLSSIIFVVIAAIFFSKTNYRNQVFYTDETGAHIMRKGTVGSARYMTAKERQQAFIVDDIRNTTAHIYGQETKNGEKVVGYKKPKYGGTGTQNVLVIASAGSGKSFTIGRVNLLQTIDRGDSFVCSDPSGELYRSISGYCKKKGVDVHVLNLKEPEYSEFWNCLEETIDPATERLDSTRLNDFANIYMENAGDAKKDFWYSSALNLVKAVIGYVAYKKEKEITDMFAEFYIKIMNGKQDAISDRMQNQFVGLPWCREQILDAAEQKGLDLDEVEDILYEIQYVAPKISFSIKKVYECLLHFSDIEQDMKNIPEWHPAKYAYLMYQTSDNENVRTSALQGAQLRFSLFTDTKVQEILSHDGMHISDINKKQSAYFICMSDTTNTLKPIASLFFSFMFKDLQQNWDRAQNEVGEGNKNPCLETTIMLDEFFSCGVIGGNPETFGTYMSNSRKRELHIFIIIQGYSQLEALYGPEIKNVIQGQCSTLIYLGGNDPDTVKFISDFATGDTTVLAESHYESANPLSNRVGRTNTVNTVKRSLMTTDEARRFKQVLVVRQGEYPAKIKAFPWIEHPAYLRGDCQSVNIYNEIKPVGQRLEEMNMNKPADVETYTFNLLNNKINKCLHGTEYNEETGEIIEKSIESVDTVNIEDSDNTIDKKTEETVQYKNLTDNGILDPSKMKRVVSGKKSKSSIR